MDRRQQILAFGNAIAATFTSSEWTEIGYLTATDTYINNHSRLLRSLHWGDNDYKGCVFDAVEYILAADDANLRHLFDYEPISRWLKTNEPASFQAIQAHLHGFAVPEAIPTGSQVALAALADARALLETRGPTSAVDRVHTGLHGFLKSTCSEAGIVFQADATPNQLLKSLLEEHPALLNLGPRGEQMRRLIKTSASIVDSMGTLRNRASLAHPNEELLDEDEALFVINLGRSLLTFLDSKIKGSS